MITKQQIGVVQQYFGIDVTGEIDDMTKSAIKNFNLRDGKGSAAELDKETIDRIFKRIPDVTSKISEIKFTDEQLLTEKTESEVKNDFSTDLSENSVSFDKKMLSFNEYVTDYGKKLKKEYIFLHHTSGWNNPYNTITDWENDDRGKIGTHYVIGGINISTGDSQYDGDIVKCIPDEYFGWHLGSTSKDGINFAMHTNSIGIEICNFGYLIKKDNLFYTYTGKKVDKKYVTDLGYKFRGYQYWHSYTENQINSLYVLIKFLSNKFNININKGLKEWLVAANLDSYKAFEFKTVARDGKIKGLLSHSNVRKDKTDVFPQPELIAMIKSL